MNAALIAEIFLMLGAAAKMPGIEKNTIGGWLELVGGLINQGAAMDADLRVLRDQIRAMVEEDRNPTAEEWAVYDGLSMEAHDIIQGWREVPPLPAEDSVEETEGEEDDDDPKRDSGVLDLF